MSFKLNFFRTLSIDEIKKYNFKEEDAFYYYSSYGSKIPLISKEDGAYVSIESNDGEWACENFGLGIKSTVSLQKSLDMFSENGVAYPDSELGLVMLWSSSESKKKGIVGIKQISKTNDTQTFEYEKYFSRSSFHGSIEISFVLVLLQESSQNLKRSINNNPGIQLGVFSNKTLRLDGTGSIFPIKNINDKNESLWIISMDYEDPTIDLFCDTIKISLNIAHKDYKYIDLKNKDYCCDKLINEIIASAIKELFFKLKLSGYLENINNKEYGEGSIMQVVKYLIETKGFITTNVESISKSISKYFDAKGV